MTNDYDDEKKKLSALARPCIQTASKGEHKLQERARGNSVVAQSTPASLPSWRRRPTRRHLTPVTTHHTLREPQDRGRLKIYI